VADDATMRAGGWQTRVGVGLHGQRLGLLGLGRIGALVARVGIAFGMDVVAWSQNLTAERAAEVGARLVDIDELLATSDVVSIHLVLSDRTRGLLGANELAAMKPTAFLVNTSRGPIVDHDALVNALRDGTIAGAGLDVFDVEPLPADDPLRALPNTVLTPHTGYVVSQCYEIFYREIVADIAAWRGGQPIRVIANR
jgi:phosphoglycerate dehydrogenase-like enzyme